MKKIILLSALMVASKMSAEPAEPIAPTVFAPWSTNLRNADDTPYVGTKGGYDLTLENKNSKTIFCRDTTFTAPMDEFGNSCGNVLASPTINFGDANQTLEIPPNGEFKKAGVGSAERMQLEKKAGAILEFCDRQALMKNFRCGFNCTDNHRYGDKWDEDLTGGSRKRICDATGTPVTVPGTFTCLPGYDRDDTKEICIPRLCDNRYSVGSKISFDMFDGARNNQTSGSYQAECLTSGVFGNPIPGTFSCTIDYYLNGNGSACVHKSTRASWALSNNIGGCADPSQANTQACRTGTVRWCNSNGYGSSGFGQEYGAQDFAAICFDPDHIDLINRSDIPLFNQNNVTDGYFRNSLVAYCQKRYGVSFGLVHEEGANGALLVSCSKSALFHIDNPARDDANMKNLGAQHSVGGCLGLVSDETGPACHALAHRYCASKGYSGGYISGRYGATGSDIQCISGGYFKGIDYR